jgi:GH18 family chitinase
MTVGTTAILRIISDEYNIPYKELIKLVQVQTTKTKKKTLEFITLQNTEYLYNESTNTLYTFDVSDPINTKSKYGYLIPETLEVVSTNGL